MTSDLRRMLRDRGTLVRRPLLSALLLLSLVFLLAGCRLSFTELTQTAVAYNPPTPVGTPDPAFATERGQAVFNGVGMCSTCHFLDGVARATGPDFGGLIPQLEARMPATEIPDFLRQSIVDVKAAVLEGWRDDLMPANYTDILTPQQIDDVIAYMLTLE